MTGNKCFINHYLLFPGPSRQASREPIFLTPEIKLIKRSADSIIGPVEGSVVELLRTFLWKINCPSRWLSKTIARELDTVKQVAVKNLKNNSIGKREM